MCPVARSVPGVYCAVLRCSTARVALISFGSVVIAQCPPNLFTHKEMMCMQTWSHMVRYKTFEKTLSSVNGDLCVFNFSWE